MKLSNLFWGLLGVMAFSACSNDEIMPENDSPEFDASFFILRALAAASPIQNRIKKHSFMPERV